MIQILGYLGEKVAPFLGVFICIIGICMLGAPDPQPALGASVEVIVNTMDAGVGKNSAGLVLVALGFVLTLCDSGMRRLLGLC